MKMKMKTRMRMNLQMSKKMSQYLKNRQLPKRFKRKKVILMKKMTKTPKSRPSESSS